ncbi:MAG TPA: ABC transporter ATP-binding protein [Gaiellaceae bacterium]
MSLLEVDSVHVEYERRGLPPVPAVAGVDLEVGRGQIVALVGESGCGKSTLARAVVGLLAPRRGEVRFEGRPVLPVSRGARPPEQVRLQMIFQDPYSSLNPRRRVESQILDGQRGLRGSGRRMEAGELLERVGLSPVVAKRYPHEFSGGQRQRIAIARALAADPALIVADEPVTSLDASSQAQVTNLLGALCREMEMGMLFISHDLALVRHVADVVAVMYLGRIVELGPTDDLWEAPMHPYTRALIAAVPVADGKRRLPEALPGEVPDPARPPVGCRFRPRCPHAFDRCVDEPPLLGVGARAAACWLVDEERR